MTLKCAAAQQEAQPHLKNTRTMSLCWCIARLRFTALSNTATSEAVEDSEHWMGMEVEETAAQAHTHSASKFM